MTGRPKEKSATHYASTYFIGHFHEITPLQHTLLLGLGKEAEKLNILSHAQIPITPVTYNGKISHFTLLLYFPQNSRISVNRKFIRANPLARPPMNKQS